MTEGSAIDVVLKPTWVPNVGYRYDMILDGETIVSQSRDPEYDAARVLHARGVRGWFRTIDFKTGRPRMSFNIEKAAKLRTIERDDGRSITVGLYQPMSAEDKARARPHSLHQGRLIPAGMAPDTRQAGEAAGGESGAERRRLHQAAIHGDSSVVPPEPADDTIIPVEHEDA